MREAAGTLAGMNDLRELADRYVAVWNEPDPDVRRDLIRSLWAPHGAQVLVDPPEEVRAAADRLQFRVPPFEVHGYGALDARVTRAYEMFVESGEYVFTLRDGVSRLLPNVVTLPWAMVSREGEEVAGGGVEVLALDDDGRIRTDFQFIG
jgi:hypothetical protein